MIVTEDNLDKLLELRRNIECLLAEVENRLELISKSKATSNESLILGNIAYLGLRYSSTTRAPPNYNDLTGKELAKTPSYRFPCPTTALIQVSQLYSAKPVVCMKPEITVNETSYDSKMVVISCLQRDVEIIYKLNNSVEQHYFEPFLIKGPGVFNITAFSKKTGFRNSSVARFNVTISNDIGEEKYKEISSNNKSIPDSKMNAAHVVCNDVNNKSTLDANLIERDSKHTKKQHIHAPSKYRGLHLTRSPIFSDDDDDDGDDDDDSIEQNAVDHDKTKDNRNDEHANGN